LICWCDFGYVPVGKVYDETGDRFTPSYSRKNGKRLRYYISYRLTKQSGEKDIAGWRLPAQTLEDQIVKAVSGYLKENTVSRILITPSVEVIQRAVKITDQIGPKPTDVVNLVERVDIALGSIQFRLNQRALSEFLRVGAAEFNSDALVLKLPS
jgi:hypothetical protein